MKRILFVCLGNICRSPAAEGVMHKLLQEEGLQDLIEVDSAGTSSYHIGEPADKRMRAAAGRQGFELPSRARMVARRDFDEFDLIVAMDRENLRQLQALTESPTQHVRLLSEYLDDDWPADVPDPYYGGDEGFEQVLSMLIQACPAILEDIQNR